MAELIIAEGLFLATMKRRKYFSLRLIAAVVSSVAFAYFFPNFSDHPLYMSFTFISIFVFTLIAMKFVFEESILKLSYCAVAGYTVQHLAYQANNVVTVAMAGSSDVSMGMYGQNFAPTFSNPFFTIIYFFCSSRFTFSHTIFLRGSLKTKILKCLRSLRLSSSRFCSLWT